ncbi:MAG: LysR family transcriptional regulator [Aliivibrio sp.]|uniref:LysR substrate-binding domain-containing protein n=1 Tax=Aliivibrio sp. TaxID=1872443 RepID=UPI001A42E7B9|nr:LysR family transcriptional regulator [Aliivibrio sp.]
MNKTNPPLKSLYAFVAVADCGSMTAAAKTLNVSHSAVSQSIKTLELQLNTQLFKRVGRQVELNREGFRYYKKVAPAIAQIQLATAELSAPKNSNRITLNMVNSLALHWWIPKVDQFQQEAPHIDIRISSLPFVFDLDDEGIDVALIHGNKEEWKHYHFEHLADDELILVCSPALLNNACTDEPLKLVEQFPAIYVTNPRRQDDWHIWAKAMNVIPPKRQPNLSFDATIQSMQAARNGLGILVTHKEFVLNDLQAGVLTQISQEVLHPTKAFYFACNPDQLNKESVLTLKAWLIKMFNRSQ